MSWHIDTLAFEAYAAGRLDPAAELSVETHLTGCADCRAAARSHVAPVDVWAGVRDTIRTPEPSRLHRVLRRLGVREDDAVVVSAADTLVLPWVLSVAFAVASAVGVGFAGLGPAGREAAFLALAPLVPVLTVVTSYDALDPLREVAAPTAYSKLRLALLRATAALAVAVPVTVLVGFAVPPLEALALVWLAPGLGLTSAALVLLTWFEARVTGALLASVWVGVVVLLRVDDRVSVLTTPAAQLAFVAGTALLAGALVLRTSTLRLQGGEL
jgi:hypothetical protein